MLITAERLEKESFDLANLLAKKLGDIKLASIGKACGCSNIIQIGYEYSPGKNLEEVAERLANYAKNAVQFIKISNKPGYDSTVYVMTDPLPLALRVVFFDKDITPEGVIPVYQDRFRVDIMYRTEIGCCS